MRLRAPGLELHPSHPGRRSRLPGNSHSEHGANGSEVLREIELIHGGVQVLDVYGPRDPLRVAMSEAPGGRLRRVLAIEPGLSHGHLHKDECRQDSQWNDRSKVFSSQEKIQLVGERPPRLDLPVADLETIQQDSGVRHAAEETDRTQRLSQDKVQQNPTNKTTN